jgi:hypothetical protein
MKGKQRKGTRRGKSLFVGWVRRLGARLVPRGWQSVASGHTEADCWRATEAARVALPWAVCEWTVLPVGTTPDRTFCRRPPLTAAC